MFPVHGSWQLAMEKLCWCRMTHSVIVCKALLPLIALPVPLIRLLCKLRVLLILNKLLHNMIGTTIHLGFFLL